MKHGNADGPAVFACDAVVDSRQVDIGIGPQLSCWIGRIPALCLIDAELSDHLGACDLLADIPYHQQPGDAQQHMLWFPDTGLEVQ